MLALLAAAAACGPLHTSAGGAPCNRWRIFTATYTHLIVVYRTQTSLSANICTGGMRTHGTLLINVLSSQLTEVHTKYMYR
jgi:hypothetical protein